MSVNQITTCQLACGTWRVAEVKAVRISAKRSSNGSLRIFHTPSMAEASHIAQMWRVGDYSREAGSLRHFNPGKPPCDTP